MTNINPRSIIFAARLVGAITALLLIAATLMALYLSIQLDKRNEIQRAVMLYDLLFMTKPTPEAFARYLKEHQLTPVGGEVMKRIREEGKPFIEDPLLRRTFQSGNIEIFVYDMHCYYAYKMHDMYYYRSDKEMTPYMLYILIAATLVLVTVILLYRYMSGSIEPLQNLHRQILRFADGEKGIDTKVEGSDEVAQVANAFHDSVQKIEALQRSRSLFLRNVMHELKTPISKGKLLAHLLEINPKDKAILEELFEQMQGHLNDLARVESLTARHLQLDIRFYACIDVLDQAIDLLDVPRSELEITVGNEKIMVDFDLFAYALKNLIDNAVKYASHRPVSIAFAENCLRIANAGEPFKEEYTHYLKAYQRDLSQHSLEGMGLGLYIVNEIVTRHGYALRYAYEEGQHVFKICFDNAPRAAQLPET
ncbi:ArsS family sensor histidine kinase [Sulfurimonas sp. HSL1-6]|uniref:ArsS family sensor histidine kinase n=1 Tax=Thiomicrolovo immobilis TaxID=3131935 RepID=UPI0031F8B1FC